jgi:hypothetical protein
MPDETDRNSRGLRQIPEWWLATLYVVWMILLTLAFVIHVPALGVVAFVMATLQTGYIICVAGSRSVTGRGSRKPPSPRQAQVMLWWRLALFVAWIGLLVVGFIIRVPALAIMAMAMAALQTVYLFYLAKMRQASR